MTKRLWFVVLICLIVPALSFAGSPTKQAKKELLTRVIHDMVNGACSRMYQMTTGEKTKKNSTIRFVSRKFRGISFGAPSLEDERCRVTQLTEFGPPFNQYEITFINGPFEGDMITYQRIDNSEGRVKFRTKKFGKVTATVYWMAGDCSIQNVKLSK